MDTFGSKKTSAAAEALPVISRRAMLAAPLLALPARAAQSRPHAASDTAFVPRSKSRTSLSAHFETEVGK